MEFRVYKNNNPQIGVSFLIGGELNSQTYSFQGLLRLILDGGLCKGEHILLQHEQNDVGGYFFSDDIRMVVDLGKTIKELFLDYDHKRTYSNNFLDLDVIYFKQVGEVEYIDFLITKDRYTIGYTGIEDEENSLLKIDDDGIYKNKSGQIKEGTTVFHFEDKGTLNDVVSLKSNSQSSSCILKENIYSKKRGIFKIVCLFVLYVIMGSIIGNFNGDMWGYTIGFMVASLMAVSTITFIGLMTSFNKGDDDKGVLIKGNHGIVKNYKNIGEYFITNPKINDAVNSIRDNMNREVRLRNGYITRLYELIASNEDRAYMTEDVYVLGNSEEDDLDKSLCSTPCLDEEGFYTWYSVLVLNSKAEEEYNKNKELTNKLEDEERLRIEKHKHIIKNKENQERLRQESKERLGYNIIQKNLQDKVGETNKDLDKLYSNLNKREVK